MSPDGSRVVITGKVSPFSSIIVRSEGIGTVAYDASRGAQTWAARCEGPNTASTSGVTTHGVVVFTLRKRSPSGLYYWHMTTQRSVQPRRCTDQRRLQENARQRWSHSILIHPLREAAVSSAATAAEPIGHRQRLDQPGGQEEYIVNLTAVPHAQVLAVRLSTVNSADISQTKSQSGQAVSGSNFHEDVPIDGSVNSADISLVKSKSGTALPASP